MRTVRDDDSKTVEPKKKINAKIKTVRLRANLKLTHWYEKAALSISATPGRPSTYKLLGGTEHAGNMTASGNASHGNFLRRDEATPD
jgi:hypothetical protein